MKQEEKIVEIIQTIQGPVLIISSEAGLGNYSVGKNLFNMFSIHQKAIHGPIEQLIPQKLKAAEFDRHEIFCKKFPFLLYLINKFPLSYFLKKMQETILKTADLNILQEYITQGEFSTIIATNHRAAFWISSLKRRGVINCELWGVVTDYILSPGWKYIFWEQVNHLWGPISREHIPPPLQPIYQKISLPVDPNFETLKKTTGDKNHILITGGGWGLGPIDKTIETLHLGMGHLTLHVACGNNLSLFKLLQEKYKGNQKIIIYGFLPSLFPLFSLCKAVISKPGALTITEAIQSGKALFLLPGLPGVEQANARYTIRYFSAKPFKFETFSKWYQSQSE